MNTHTRPLTTRALVTRPPVISMASGAAMVSVILTIVLVSIIGLALVSLARINLFRASSQGASARSFYVAQTGLQRAIEYARANPSMSTSDDGFPGSVGGDEYTFWVDAGPVAPSKQVCGEGVRAVEAVGSVTFSGRAFSSRLRACGVPAPIATALFGVSTVEFHGGRAYIAPYNPPAMPCVPGRGGSLGSFAEMRFIGNAQINALGYNVTLRDGTVVPDYTLYCLPALPDGAWASEPAPSILGAFGPILKAQPTTGVVANRCGTRFACVAVDNKITDATTIPALRSESVGSEGIFMSRMVRTLMQPVTPCEPPFARFCPAVFGALAKGNGGNATLNRLAADFTATIDLSLMSKQDSFYTGRQFNEILAYLAQSNSRSAYRNPGMPGALRGVVYVDGTVSIASKADLGGSNGDLTLVIAGDLIVNADARNVHDLTTIAGRKRPGIIVLGSPTRRYSAPVCGGKDLIDGSGQLVLCAGRWVGDGLLYTQSGLVVEDGTSLEQIGALYNGGNLRNTSPSFELRDGTVILRYDPLALTALGEGFSQVSWQQLK